EAAAATVPSSRSGAQQEGVQAATSDQDRAPPQLLVLVAFTGDGRVWRWDAPLPALTAAATSAPAAPSVLSADHAPHLHALAGAGGAGTSSSYSGAQLQRPAAGLPERLPAVPRSVAGSPQLTGLLHTLPSAVSTFAVYPRPVAATSLRPGAAGAEAGGGVVLLGAAGTMGGSVELFTVQRGLVSPLALHVSSSLLVHKDAPVRGVRWLGASPRLVTFSSEKGGTHDKAQWNNHLNITDVRSGRTVQLPRWEYGNGPGGGGGEPAPLLGVRASPCGSYLLVLMKGASAELWGVWPGVTPTRLRLLDLPFSCVEWVQPPLPYRGQSVQPDDLTTWTVSSEPPPGPPLQPQPTAPPSVGRGSYDSSGGGAGPGGSYWSMPQRLASGMGERPTDTPSAAEALPPGASSSSSQPPLPLPLQLPPPSPPPAQQPQFLSGQSLPAPQPLTSGGLEEAQLIFTLADGRAGVLSVRGRRVADTRVKRPMAGLLSPLEISATAMAAVGRLVVMGDAEGRLAVWEWSTGRTTLQATGLGLVRKIVISPAIAGTAAARPSLNSPPPPSFSASALSLMLPSESSFLAPLLPAKSASLATDHSPAVADFPPLPPPSSSSPPAHIGSSSGSMKARVAVLFATGHCCVFDLDSTNKLRLVVATAAAGVRPVLDLALLPFWWIDPGTQTVGSGDGSSGNVSLMAVVTDEGSLSVLDLGPGAAALLPTETQQLVPYPAMASPLRPPLPSGLPLGKPHERVFGGIIGRNADGGGGAEAKASLRPSRRLPSAGGGGSRGWALAAALQPPLGPATSAVASGASVEGAVHGALRLHLAQARGLASCLLLPRPWAMLLRLLLQLGVSQELLRYLCGAYSPGEAEEEDVRLELLALFPRAARAPLLELLADRGRLNSQSSSDVHGSGLPPPSHAVAANGSRGNAVPALDGPWIPSQTTATATTATASAAASASGSNSTGAAAASTLLALSNSFSSTALALSSNMLRAVSSSLASTLTPAIGGAAISSAAATVAAADRPAVSGTEGLRVGAEGADPGPATGDVDADADVDGGGGGGIGTSSSRGRLPHHGTLLHLLRMLASMRAQGRLLHPDEWLSYSRALAPGSSPAERMAVAAHVAGDSDEARFWSHLPATLASVRERQEYHIPGNWAEGVDGTAAVPHASVAAGRVGAGSDLPYRQLQRTASASAAVAVQPAAVATSATELPGPSGPESRSGPRTSSVSSMTTTVDMYDAAAAGGAATSVGGGRGAVLLWDERLVLAEAQERIKWREAHSGAVLDMGPEQQERRLLEYMSVGDLQTAVAFLLASSPENSARYYRDALCTLALAAAAAAGAAAAAASTGGAAAAGASGTSAVPPRAIHGGGGAGANGSGNVGMLLAQSAKVISAHAASIGDVHLGVPLHLAAGLHAEAALVLQESGMWRLAAVMTAHFLTGTERAQTLQRWALHVWRQEGSVWRGVGLLAAAGCLREALRLLLDAGLPDCAAAFVAGCKHAGLESALAVPAPAAPVADGATVDEWIATPRVPASAFVNSAAAAGAAAASSEPAVLFDGGLTPFESMGSGIGLGVGGVGLRPVTASRPGTRGGPFSSPEQSNSSNGGRRFSSADLMRAAAEFDLFVTDLLTSLL
ncbi:hypothetical protein VaNZ11_006472, partial [Volvox africanus]